MAKSSQFDRPFRREFELAEAVVEHQAVYVVDESGAKVKAATADSPNEPEEIGDRSRLSMERVLDTPATRGTMALAYWDDDGGSYLKVIAIAIDANGNTTHGTPVQVLAYASPYFEVCSLDRAAGKFAIVYNDTSDYPTLVVGTVSGTTITLGTPVALGSAAGYYLDVCRISDTELVAVYNNTASSNEGRAAYCTVSGTTITIADDSVFIIKGATYCKVCRLSSASFAVHFNYSYTALCIGGAISGGVIASWGTATTVTAPAYVTFDAIAVADNKTVHAYQISPPRGRVKAVSWSGTTPTIGTEAAFSIYTAEADLSKFDDRDNYFCIAYKIRAARGLYRGGCKVDGTTITVGTSVLYSAQTPSGAEIVGLEDFEMFLAWHLAADSETWTWLISPFGEASIERTIGVLEEAGAIGESKWVTLLGGVYEQKTGMTPGQLFYLDTSTGRLTTAITDYRIGVAIDDDRLKLLFPDNDFGA